MKERDLDRTITGLLFNPYFILGLIRIILGLSMPFFIFMLFNSDEPLFLRIFGCLVLAFSFIGCFIGGIPNIRKAWNDWRSYVRFCKEEETDEAK